MISIHNRKYGIVSDKASSINKSFFFSAEPEISFFTPSFCPGIPQQPVFSAFAIWLVEINAHANKCYSVIRATLLWASTFSLSIINDSIGIMFDTFVDPHWNCHYSFTQQFLQISWYNMIVSFEAFYLEDFLGVVVGAFAEFVLVRVGAGWCEAVVQSIVESINGLATDASKIGEHVAVNKLLFW